jgi:hypothetical protein
MKKLYKIHCNGCNYTFPVFDERLKKCEECGSTLLKEENISANDCFLWLELELESANHHDYIELPRKIFERLTKCDNICVDTEKDELKVAQIITEEFYKNI